jgi:ectoine hydroxylase-related dioxygenase (phytanoyl-CoA dioxygenase family)
MESTQMRTVVAQGEPIGSDYLGSLRDSAAVADAPEELVQRMETDGYVYLRGFFDREDVMAARRDIFTQLAAVDEIAEPVLDGIFTGKSTRDEKHTSRGAFWRSVSETWTLRRLSHGRQLHSLMDRLLGETSRAQDYIFLRPAGPGKHTHIHCDAPFFTRSTERVATAWVALGDVPSRMGPLFVVENSHRFEDIAQQYHGFDVSTDTSRKASIEASPLEFAKSRHTRLLTTDFTAGDVVVFGMYLLHGALDNSSTRNEVRLSCDVRYQIASAEQDSRYFGTDPTGTTGASYAELVGAKAMTEDWHQR